MESTTYMLNAFTVDVEDYYQVSAFENQIPRSRWGELGARVLDSTRRILRLMAEGQVHGTFFVLGWVAHQFPQLVRDIARDGHEIASHGYWHRLVYRQTPDEFREDIRLSKRVLEDLTGTPVQAYRAPSFSITKQSWWALTVLAEEGFRIDSSIVPTRHDRYGVPSADRRIHPVSTSAGTIWEFPLAVVNFRMFTLPVSGGGYFRLYPYVWTRRCLRDINSRDPFLFYIHPWELDPEQPRVPGISLTTRFRHYIGLQRTESRLRSLLGEFKFGRIADLPMPFANEPGHAREVSPTNSRTTPEVAPPGSLEELHRGPDGPLGIADPGALAGRPGAATRSVFAGRP